MKTFLRLFCLFCFSSFNAFAGEWTKQLEFDGEFTSVRFFNDRLGLAVAREANYTRGAIYRTSDAGQNWQKVFADSGSTISQVRFTDSVHARAASVTEIDNKVRIKLLLTDDAGLSWYQRPAPDSIHAFACLDSSRMLIVSRSIVLGTDDAGATWHEVWKDSSVNLSYARYATTDTILIYGMTVESPHRTVVVISTDEGKTWTKNISEERLYGGFFLDCLNGYTTFHHHFLRTDDGGITWDTVYYDSSRSLYTGFGHWIHFTDFRNGWVVGATPGPPTILRTRDGGHSWSQDPEGLSICNHPMDVWFANTGSGWVVGKHETWQGKDLIRKAIIMHYTEATGVEEQETKEDFPISVHGNSLELHTAAGTSASCSLYDVLGNMLLRSEREMPAALDISAIPDGVYFVTLESGGSILRKKICIAR